jgi:hypothetical protein
MVSVIFTFFYSKDTPSEYIGKYIFYHLQEELRKQTACLCIIMQFILMEIRLSYMHIVHIKVNKLLL